MMYIRWLFLAALSIIVTLLTYLVAPLLPAFARDQLGLCDNASTTGVEPRLPDWLSWFQTLDNSLWGDSGWRTIHCPDHWDSYFGMVQWLWRNPAYGFDWSVLAAKIDPAATVTYKGDQFIDNGIGRAGWCFTRVTNPDGKAYWNVLWINRIGSKHCTYFNFGWKLKTYAEAPCRTKTAPLAMLCCSPRISNFG